jgi:hypothetical protein
MIVTVHRSIRASALALLIPALLAACSTPGTSSIPPPPEGSPAATLEPTATVTPSIAPSEGAPTPEPPIPEPPAASIAVEGGDPFVGELGSFSWQNSGSDSPWLEGTAIHVGSGEELHLTLAEPVAIENWTASRVPPGNPQELAPVGLGEGSRGRVTFDGPPSGTWSVKVSIWFADNLGSAAYYWLIEVD